MEGVWTTLWVGLGSHAGSEPDMTIDNPLTLSIYNAFALFNLACTQTAQLRFIG